MLFTYTIDDFREAYAAEETKGKRKRSSGIVGWLLFALLAAVYFFLLQRSPSPGTMAPQIAQPPAIDALVLLAPQITAASLLLGFFIMAVTLARLNRREASTHASQLRRRKVAGGLFMALVIAVMLFNSYVMNAQRRAIELRPEPSTQLFIAYIPWVVFLLVGIPMIRLLRRSNIQRKWMQYRSYHRPKELEFDAEKFILRDAAAERHIRWANLLRYRETENLLIVHSEDGQFYFFPKRAFETPEQLMQIRSVIHTNIAEGKFLPQQSAFPVAVPRAVHPVCAVPK